MGTDRQQSVLRDALPARNAYSPYGISRAGAVPGLAFCGQYRDPLTGGYPLGNGRRFYSPALMRFMTPDSLSPFSKGGINGYAYCGGDPVNRHDPSGAFWEILLRIVGVASSSTTLFGALARTARNVVGRRSAFRAASTNAGRENQTPHQEPPHSSRVSNQQFFLTGSAGVAGQLYAAVTGVTPTVQSALDVLNTVNTVTNLSGGALGNFAAAREVVRYAKAYPHEIPGILLETTMDVTMLDEMLSNVGRWLTAVSDWIRSWRTHPYDVQQ